MSLLVSIHDVTPAHAAAVELLWAACARHRVVPALAVVPQWHGEVAIESDPRFQAWLRARVAEGAEVLLHGERHDELGSARSALDHLRALGRTAREGEFLTLDERAAAERIGRGLARLRALGLSPVGFLPPAWLAREGAHRAAFAAGLAVSEDDRCVRVAPGRSLPSPVWRWSARTPLRARLSCVVAEARWKAYRDAPLVRVALHPGDLADERCVASIERALARLTARHRAVRYAELAPRAAPAGA